MVSPDQPSAHPDPIFVSGRSGTNSWALPVQELARKHRTKRRILKVWGCVLCLFALMSALAIVTTGESRGVYVVGGVTLALGLLGTLMAVSSGHRPDWHKAPSG